MKEEALLFLGKNPNYLGHYSSLGILKELETNPKEGSVATTEAEDKLFAFSAGVWSEVSQTPAISSDGSISTIDEPAAAGSSAKAGISLYELNQQLYKNNFQPFSEEEIQKAVKKIDYWWNECKENHLMLLFKDLNYYTLFELKDGANHKNTSIGKDVVECVQAIGDIFDISVETEDGKYPIEIWVRNNAQDSLHIGFLFPYDAGVVSVGG